MKENKEIYFTALAAICFRKIDPQEENWWVTKVKQDPPDALILTPITIDDRKVGRVREIEIVEFITGTVEETIEKKLAKKSYQKDTFLFCYLSPKTMEVFSFREISKNILDKNPPIENIFLLATGIVPESIILNKELSEEELIKEASKITLIQISPFYNEVRVDPEEDRISFLSGNETAYLRFDERGKDPNWRKVSESVPPPIK
ncbi:MAG: hypothetical protein KIH67_001810 [Candidatus Moranbacteria bacterium]|nr:hypothetical protein [Candidatus Moranbacteria bacterium]